jgi:hypothetical protein
LAAHQRLKDDPGSIDLIVEVGTGHLQRWLVRIVTFREPSTKQARPLRLSEPAAGAFPTRLAASAVSAGLGRAHHHWPDEEVLAF